MEMQLNNKLLAAVASAIVASVMASPAFSQQRHEVDLKALDAGKVLLTDAIKSAEQETGGKVASAEFGSRDDRAIYELDVAMMDGTTLSVEVDPQTGQLVKNSADTDQGEAEAEGPDDHEQED